jgi:3-hydroxyisobutyrate dehydrogenase-like beta-hydroxyacid dehydrogenase
MSEQIGRVAFIGLGVMGYPMAGTFGEARQFGHGI